MHTINFYNIKTKQSISESLSGLIEESDTLEILYRCEHLCWNAKMDHLWLVFGHGPFLVIFEFPHKKYNHEQKYSFLRIAGIWTADKFVGQGKNSSNKS